MLARMDSNRAEEEFYVEHPDWFAVDADGQPYRAGDLFVACINGPYYREFLPSVLQEIIARSSPDGITDNSWSGLDRDHVCWCESCRHGFRGDTSLDLPRRPDWDEPAYRRWIEWSYAQRLALWDLNNEVTTGAGGPDCLWIGMNGGDVSTQSRRFRDHKAICERTPILMLDSQYRHERTGFQANGDAGKVLHGLLGWDTADSGEHGDVRRGTADVPGREQARARGEDVGGRRVRRRDPAVVAPHRLGTRGPSAVRHGRTAVPAGTRSTRISWWTGIRSPRSEWCGASGASTSTVATRPRTAACCRTAASPTR